MKITEFENCVDPQAVAYINPIALRTAKTLQSFGRPECNRVKSPYPDRHCLPSSHIRHTVCVEFVWSSMAGP